MNAVVEALASIGLLFLIGLFLVAAALLIKLYEDRR